MKLPNFLRKKLTPEQFWMWFSTNADALKTGDMNANMHMIADKLSRVHPDLCPGAEQLSDCFQLEISPSGIRDVVPVALKVVRAAPKIPGWKVVAFRQPTVPATIKLAGQEVDFGKIKYVETGRIYNRVDIRVFVPVPAKCPPDVLCQIGFLGMDHILGEELVITRIGEISMENIVSAPSNAQPLSDLRAILRNSN